jgi:methionyl-tRNA formyltransferase
LRVVFAGTPPFAAEALHALVRGGHEVICVLTQPDRPAGRGLRLTASAVALAAQELSLAIDRPASLRDPAAQDRLRALDPDVMVVAAYGLILPAAVLAVPRRGCINIHASLLPRWRGAAPIQRALLAGDAQTGISIMQMEAGLDTGPVLLRVPLPVTPVDTAGTLAERLSELGAQSIVTALASLDTLVPAPQDESQATYAAKISTSEAALDWSASAPELERRVRAFNPAPGARARMDGEAVKVWESRVASGSGPPGTVLPGSAARLVVACGAGALELVTVQRAGGKRMTGSQFASGRQPAAGMRFDPIPGDQ